MTDLQAHFDQFLRERTYVNNVTPKTREWYQTAFQAFQRARREQPERSQPRR